MKAGIHFMITAALITGVLSHSWNINSTDQTEIFVSYDTHSDRFTFHHDNNKFTVAHARFSNQVNKTGFSYLWISTDNNYSYTLNSSIHAYAAGLAEGYLTRELISLHFQNLLGTFCQTAAEAKNCSIFGKWLDSNMQFIRNKILGNYEDSYWYQVRLFYEQLRGLQDGYLGTPGKISFEVKDYFGLYLLQIEPEIEDIFTALFDSDFKQRVDRCTGFVKLHPGDSGIDDVFVSHVTWADYNTMLRILKHYNIYLRKSPIESEPALGSIVSFSSYPGNIVSLDDFYVLSSGMVAVETTNPVPNKQLFKKVTSDSVLSSIRGVVANRLGERGKDWCTYFSQYNSGTYNNQWVIVDFKQYDSYFKQILPGFLHVLEQIPGYIHHEDLTQVLLNTSYWGSFNIPYFSDISELSGMPEYVAKYGDLFDHEKAPRARIFRRDAHLVQDLKSLIRLMRYNSYTTDPFGKCNCTPPYSAVNGIAARNDLNPPDGIFPNEWTQFGLWGGIDMKATSYKMTLESLDFVAVSGPTFQTLPPFQWSLAYNGSTVLHLGHPDLFKFGPVFFKGTF